MPLASHNNFLSQVKKIDFCSLASVRKCAKELLEEEENIHILVNNAGQASGSFTKSVDNLDNLMQSNHFGPFLFTNLLLGKYISSFLFL